MKKNMDGYCVHCAEHGPLHRHHLVPRMHGGSDDPTNIVLICPKCHGKAHVGYRHPRRDLHGPYQLPSGDAMSAKQAADHFQISMGTIYKWLIDTSIPFLRIGRAVRFDAAELDRWMRVNRSNG